MTHGLHLQNATSGFTMELDDGTPVLLRPVLPEDRERVRIAITEMSRESRYRRFFSSVLNPGDDLLRYLTEVDQQNHVAWCALDPLVEGQPGLGIARFIRNADDPTLAEVALTVRDDMQGQGLGTLLLAILYLLAPRHTVSAFQAIVLADNYSVADWFRALGAKGHFEAGLLEFHLPIHSDPADLPSTPTALRFQERLQQMAERLNAVSTRPS